MLPYMERARNLLANDGVEFVVVTSPINVRYFSQYRPGIQGIVGWWNAPKIVLLPISKDMKPVLIDNVMDSWDIARARDKLCEPRFYGRFVMEFGDKLDADMKQFKTVYEQSLANPRDAYQIFDDFVASWDGQTGPLTVGVEDYHLPSRARDRLREKHPSLNLKNVDETLRKVRMVKTDDEVEMIRKSSAINVKGFRAAAGEIRPGAKESILAEAYLQEISKYDAHPCFVMINAGPRSAALFPSYDKSYRIKKGDTVRIDVGCEYNGYCSDVSRTITVGKVSEEKKRIVTATTKGYVETIKILKPSLPIRKVFDHAVSTVQAAGIPRYRRTNVGHGIGLETHELPDLVPSSTDALEENMVINIETPYYSFGIGGFSCEDTVRITKDSCKLLTHLERIVRA